MPVCGTSYLRQEGGICQGVIEVSSLTVKCIGVCKRSVIKCDEVGEVIACSRSIICTSLVGTLAEQGFAIEAVSHLATAIQINPGSAENHSRLGTILAKSGKIRRPERPGSPGTAVAGWRPELVYALVRLTINPHRNHVYACP